MSSSRPGCSLRERAPRLAEREPAIVPDGDLSAAIREEREERI